MLRGELNYANTGMAAPLPSYYSHHQHACLTLNWTDRLRLIRFPTPVVDAIRQTILSSWHRGLQEEKPYAGAYEFKLKGNPWFGRGVESVESRVMMLSVLSTLHHHGWYLLTSTDVSKKQQDKDSLIFQLGVLPPPNVFYVSVNGDLPHAAKLARIASKS